MDNVQLIVEAGMDKEQEQKLASLCRIKYVLPSVRLYVVEIPTDRVGELKGLAGVDRVMADTHIMAQSAPVMPTGRGVTIAVLDTGIAPVEDFTNPFNRIVHFKDFVNNKSKPYDDNAHGTHVASIAAGSGFRSMGRYRGVATGANIAAVKVLDEKGRGNATDALAGIQWVIDNHKKYNIRVANLSIGTQDIGSMDPLVRAVEAAWDLGIVMVVAAGNNGPKSSSITSPGTSRKVITVGASDDNRPADIWGNQRVNFSGRGPTSECIIKPDILAPGSNIVAALSNSEELKPQRLNSLNLVGQGYVSMSGTSMASPQVAGAIALLLEKCPSLSPNEVKLFIKDSAKNLHYSPNRQGWGLLNIEGLLNGGNYGR